MENSNSVFEEMNKNLFVIGVRDNYTFSTPKGNATMLDLFRLPVPVKESDRDFKQITLEDIAISVDAEIKAMAGTSFVRRKRVSPKETILKNKLEIVKLIIEYRVTEYEMKLDAQKKLEDAAKRNAKIDEILEDQEYEELKKMTSEELKKLKTT